jgi:hypothetical protein
MRLLALFVGIIGLLCLHSIPFITFVVSIVLLRKIVLKLKTNAEIAGSISLQAIDGMERGIFLEDRQVWLEWGTFGELAAFPGVIRQRTSPLGFADVAYRYGIKNPVIFGIRLAALHAKTPPCHDNLPCYEENHLKWPVTSFEADISLGKGVDSDYKALFSYFKSALGETDISQRATWQRRGITLSLNVIGRGNFFPSCKLELRRNPSVFGCYETEYCHETEYTKTVRVHAGLRYMLFDGRLKMRPNVYTPEGLKCLLGPGEQWMIWVDERHDVFGIGNAEFSQIIKLHELDGIRFVGEFFRGSLLELKFYLWFKHKSGMTYFAYIESGDIDDLWDDHYKKIEAFVPCQCVYQKNHTNY